MISKILTALTFITAVFGLNAVKPTGDNTATCYKTVGYWGQNSAGAQTPSDQSSYEKPLGIYYQKYRLKNSRVLSR
jgi:hypothetical protein